MIFGFVTFSFPYAMVSKPIFHQFFYNNSIFPNHSVVLLSPPGEAYTNNNGHDTPGTKYMGRKQAQEGTKKKLNCFINNNNYFNSLVVN